MRTNVEEWEIVWERQRDREKEIIKDVESYRTNFVQRDWV